MIFTPNIEIESRVITDILAEPDVIPDIRALIRSDMFTDPNLRGIWDKALVAWDNGSPLDYSTIMEIPDPDLRYQLQSYILEAGSRGAHNNAVSLRNLTLHRLATSFIGKLGKMCSDGETDPSSLITAIDGFRRDVESYHASRHSVTIQEAVEALEGQIEAVRKAREADRSPYIKTGFTLLDHHFRGGLRGGNVMVLAARPGVGKTAVTLALIRSVMEQGLRAKLYSLEMPATEIAERFMFSLGGLDMWSTRTGELDRAAFASAVDRVRDWGLTIEDSLSNIGDIVSDAAILHQRGEVDVIFVDHLRLLRTGDPKLDSNIYARTCEITRQVKGLALKSMLPVVYCCQLNRDSPRLDKDPDLQDLRDSGSIEEDADKVVFLRRLKAKSDGEPVRLKMIIGKNRQGGGAYESVWLYPDKTYSNFTETEADMPEAAAEPYVDPVDKAAEELFEK